MSIRLRHTLLSGAILLGAMLLCATPFAQAASPTPVFTVGIVPQQSASVLARLWIPVLNYLSRKSGYALQFSTAPDIPTFEARLRAGQYDFAYMNPYHYSVFSRDPGYRAFAKQADKAIVGILVVHKSARITSLHGLAGHKVAFPAPKAFAATMLPLAALRRDKIGVTPVFVKSHDSVYWAVARGLYPAGGGIERTFNNVAPALRTQLRVLWRSQPYPPHAFAARADIDPKIVRAVQEAMVAMHNDPQGRVLLADLNFTGIEAASDGEWARLREEIPGHANGSVAKHPAAKQ